MDEKKVEYRCTRPEYYPLGSDPGARQGYYYKAPPGQAAMIAATMAVRFPEDAYFDIECDGTLERFFRSGVSAEVKARATKGMVKR